MTTQTPIATVWDGDLLRPALQASTDATRFSEDSGRVLVEHGDPFGTFLEETWLSQPVTMLGDQFLVTATHGLSEAFIQPARWIRYQVTPGGIITMLEGRAAEDVPALHRGIEELKDRLDCDWEPIVRVLGVKRRTFFTHRKAGILPLDRVADIRARVGLLDSMAREDLDTTRLLLASKEEDIVELFAAGDYDGVRSLFATVREQLSPWVSSVRADLVGALIRHSKDIAAMVAQPAFEALASTYASFRPLGHELHRTRALVEVEEAVQAGHDGSPLEERWDFLPTLTHDQMDEFRDVAAAFIRSPEFTPDAWDGFVEQAAARAWDVYSPLILPPDEADPIPAAIAAPRWEPDPMEFTVIPLAERLAR